MGILGVFLLIICVLLGLIILAQNPKGGGLAQGFTGAQQIGGVQKTANFLERGTWTLATLLLVVSLFSAMSYGEKTIEEDEFDTRAVLPTEFDNTLQIDPNAGQGSAPATPANPEQ